LTHFEGSDAGLALPPAGSAGAWTAAGDGSLGAALYFEPHAASPNMVMRRNVFIERIMPLSDVNEACAFTPSLRCGSAPTVVQAAEARMCELGHCRHGK
jgi:hypothetical protein